MLDKELDAFLDEHFREELRWAPRRHREATDQCPSLRRFPAGVRSGWRGQPENRRHVSQCRFCQKLTAMQWRIECPALAVLVRNSLAGAPDAAALAMHIREDHCVRCRAISELVQQGTSALAAAGEAALEVMGRIQQVVLGQDRWAVAGQMAPVTMPQPQLFQTSADGSLMANLRVAEGNQLLLWVRSRLTAGSRSSWQVRAAVVFQEGDPLEAVIELEDRGVNGHIAEHSFGAFDEALARRMDRPFVLVVEWVD